MAETFVLLFCEVAVLVSRIGQFRLGPSREAISQGPRSPVI